MSALTDPENDPQFEIVAESLEDYDPELENEDDEDEDADDDD